MNIIPESYFVLVRVRDSNGNSIYNAGIPQSRISLVITGNTGLALDASDGKMQTIAPITVDGETFLTYPLKAARLTTGTVNIRAVAVGTSVSNAMDSKVTEGASVGSFEISGEGVAGKENRINFTLKNTSNMVVTRYEEVLSTLGLSDNGAGKVYIMPGSNILSSNNGSYFYISKNAQTGVGELYYMPFATALNGASINAESITVLKGTPAEKTWALVVKAQ